jgi:hypothetical protein
VAATEAMANGVAVMRSWPIIAAAWATAPSGCGTRERAMATAEVGSRPRPKSRAALVRSPSCNLPARLMNAVLQDIAKSSANEGDAPASPSKFLNDRPSTVMVLGQGTVEPGSRPRRSSAAVVTTLKVEPGG